MGTLREESSQPGAQPNMPLTPQMSRLFQNTSKTIPAIGAVFPGPNVWNDWTRITDGMSNTILIAQRSEPVNWMDPTGDVPIKIAVQGINVPTNGIRNGLGSLDGSEGINIAFCDGAVSFAPNMRAHPMLEAALTANGEENVQWEPEKLPR